MSFPRIKIIFLIIILFCVASVPAKSYAQNTGANHLQSMLQELDQKIASLEKIAAQFNNAQLKQGIQTIKAHRRKAVAFSRKKQYRLAEQELKIALRLSNTFLKKSVDAIVKNYQAPLEEMRRRAENQIHMHYNSDADRLLKKAKEVRQNAIRALQNGNFSKASDLYKVEKSLLENCMKILEQNAPEKYASFQSERENFLELKNQAEKSVQRSRTSLTTSLYNQAIEQARKADEALKKGNLKKANLYYQWSTRLLLRVINLTEGGNYSLSQQAKDNLNLTQQVYEGTIREYSGKTNLMAKKLLNQAKNLLMDAHVDFNQQKYSSAIQKTDVARKILLRLQSNPIQKNENYRQQLEENIRNLEQTLRTIRSNGRGSQAEETLLALANDFLSKSRNELSKQNYQSSAANLLIANRLTLQLQRIANQSIATSTFSEDTVLEKYNRLKTKVQQLSANNFDRSRMKQIYYNILQNFLQKIKLAIQKKQWNQANQYISVAETLLGQL